MKSLGRLAGYALLGAALCASPQASYAQIGLIGTLINKFMNQVFRATAEQDRNLPDALTLEERRRGIPDGARRAKMAPPEGRYVLLDGDRFQLAPGAKIKDLHNRIVMPSRIRESMEVRYTQDTVGNVFRIWLLPDEEGLTAYYGESAASRAITSAAVSEPERAAAR